jgi:hypothetical protein
MLNGKEVYKFDLEYPALSVCPINKVTLLIPEGAPDITKSVCFDGHFGIHRKLDPAHEKRTAQPKGRPRRQKKISDWERDSCANKNKERCTKPERTGGWHFAVDADTNKAVAAYEHVDNERNCDKHVVLQELLQHPGVKANLLIHDDMCHYHKWAVKHHPATYKFVRYWVIDEWHRRNHKDSCPKRELTNSEERRLRNVNTSCCEQLNSFARRYNFFLNSLRPASHRFWVHEILRHWNYNRSLGKVLIHGGFSRRNAARRAAHKKAVRKRPASNVIKRPASKVFKRPGSKVLKRPAGRAAVRKRPASNR